jgi:hypothetical protein
MNNVWIYTIKILNSGQDTLSPFHIYCVAVVPDHLDHTSVIDFYLAELKELMQGNEYYCRYSKAFLSAAFGEVEDLADQSEKAFSLNMLFGHLRQISRMGQGD